MPKSNDVSKQRIDIPLKVGDRVSLFKDVNYTEGGKGFTADGYFEDTVEQFVPQTALLRFENSDVGLAQFEEMIEECEGYQIV